MTISEEYFPLYDTVSGTPVERPAEPGSFTIDANNILDLSEAFRQYAVIATPIKPLCVEDSAGLCPVCGTNLNTHTCDCRKTAIDPRWAALESLARHDS
jgi:uncharacterized protein